MNRTLFLLPLSAGFGALALWAVQEMVKKDDSSPESVFENAEQVARQSSQRPSSQEVPYLIRTLSDPSKHLDEQITAVRNLPSSLSSQELEALIAILRKPAPDKVSSSRWYALLNEIMAVLQQPRFKFQDYTGRIGGLVADRHVDPMVRDYAAQHLSVYLGREAEQLSQEKMESGLSSLISVIKDERDSSELVSGTALMSLCDLVEKHPGNIPPESKDQLSEAVLHCLSRKDSSNLPLKLSAIQVAGRLSLEQALPLIRNLAREEDDLRLRLSSIASLGYFADPQDKALLQKLSQSNTQYRFAAQAALKKYTELGL